MVVDSKELMTVREAARQVERTAETVRRWIWDGKLPAQKLGNQLFVRRADLALLVAAPQASAAGNQRVVLERSRAIRERIRHRIGGPIDVPAAPDEHTAVREGIAGQVTPTSDFLDELRANREKIARRLGGTLDIIRMLDESREAHP